MVLVMVGLLMEGLADEESGVEDESEQLDEPLAGAVADGDTLSEPEADPVLEDETSVEPIEDTFENSTTTGTSLPSGT